MIIRSPFVGIYDFDMIIYSALVVRESKFWQNGTSQGGNYSGTNMAIVGTDGCWGNPVTIGL